MKVFAATIATVILIALNTTVSSAELSKPIQLKYPKSSHDSFGPSRNYYRSLLELAVKKSGSNLEFIARELPEIREDRGALLLNAVWPIF